MSCFFKKAFLLLILVVLIPPGVVFSGEVIQTQESVAWEGIEADLTSLRISNNILTVKVKLRNTGSKEQGVKIPYEACFIMDEANQKKYYPLKDSDGLYIAGPMSDEDRGGRFWFGVKAGKARGLWIKFPEPTDGPETITISLAGIFPFEEIPLKSKK
jgi:hypothetical protein